MDYNFNYVHVSASERLEEFTKERLAKLEKRFDFLVAAEIYFKTENSSNNDEGRICEIELSCPGPSVFASANEENFKKATVDTIDSLKTQLQKKKEKMTSY